LFLFVYDNVSIDMLPSKSTVLVLHV